ncbi:rRNA methyltransferase 3, mitochondrial [Anopheles ziemanni]|uniref:rRNA methyltransferase 3, mitochondrial n=1 Tax=Anopheles coustani TaxID=139045 RepID=UPI00265A5F6B|nr:rRNA methyltransferase 3, mitochondrial [Anopheles coustani]XP_058172550.1 rRNA methyltransferase 3, mitochondrial [Anopheles ziemanni]
MFRTMEVIRICARRSGPSVLQFYRRFSVVPFAQQKLSPELLAPRGSRSLEQPAPEKLAIGPADELAAEDELLDNRKNVPNLKLAELLKDVPRTKLARRADDGGERKKQPPKPTHKKTAIEKDTLQILQHRYQDPCESEERYDKVLKLRYTILQSNDDRYRDLMALIGSRKYREREKRLVLEGRRLIMDGCAAGLHLEAVVTSDLRLLADLRMKPKPKDCPYFLVTRQTMMEWSSLTTSPGLIGIFAEPPNLADVIARNAAGSKRLPLTVVCDNIREPNNLGSVIRSCAAVSAQEIVLLKGCAHPWDLKCLRGGAGAHFRVPIYGPKELYQLPEHTRTSSMFVIADNKRKNDEREGFLWRHYDRIDYGSADHVVLVIGGETYGVSDDIRKLVHQLTQATDGQLPDRKFLAHIPLANGVESLNTASALSIILYQMRRSLLAMEET